MKTGSRLIAAWYAAGCPSSVTQGHALVRACVNAGIADTSYPTVRWGRVGRYEKSLLVSDGETTLYIVGEGPEGDAQWLSRDGRITIHRVECVETKHLPFMLSLRSDAAAKRWLHAAASRADRNARFAALQSGIIVF